MIDLIPDSVAPGQALKETYPAIGKRRARVALHAGCAQQVLRPEINSATIRVLNRNGVEVAIPKKQVCCGALAWHAGNGTLATKLARQNVQAFDADYDAVLTNAAGCGSGIHDYLSILKDSDVEKDAERMVHSSCDVTVFLDQLGIETPPALSSPVRVAYHDACHLLHAQSVREAPRRLLGKIDNLDLVELPDAGTCCGSAGTYNIDQPDIARQLGERKAQAIDASSAQIVATGNIGCLIQIENAWEQSRQRVWHTIELIDLAYRGEFPA